jgi:uncharacterized protein
VALRSLSQKWRFLAFFLNVLTFYLVYVWASGKFSIGGSGEATWVTAAIGWWILGLVSAPWFRPPRDALAASVTAFSILVTMDLGTVASPLANALDTARSVAVIYTLVVGACALLAGWVESSEVRGPVRQAALLLSSDFARGEALFAGPALVSIFAFYQSDPVKLALVALWIGFALLRPYELMIDFVLKTIRKRVPSLEPVGAVRRVDHPGIVRVALSSEAGWHQGNLHAVRLAGDEDRFVVPLFTQVHDNELLGTGICIGDASGRLAAPECGQVYRLDEPEVLSELMSEMSGQEASCELAGFVVEGSEISSIRFEVASAGDLEEGAVVFCQLAAARVYYQIINAHIAEESFMQNPRGTHIVHAAQLGTYDTALGFRKYPWLPSMNQPVFRPIGSSEETVKPQAGDFVVGIVPSIGIPVTANLHDLVEYHSAILGVTGTGKTELALDIVRTALDQGTKVVIVDLTGEYRQRLSDCSPQVLGLEGTEADDLEARLFAVETGTYGAGAEKRALKSFLDSVREATQERVTRFLTDAEHGLAILELAEVTNTRATLRTTELFLSQIILWARQHRRAKQILIVLEEAHTIIPETSGSGFDYDTQWVVSRIGQIALQGRKYGVGLLVVSQRTALVSKTILSQCNTYFVHCLVDQTSLSYLGNVFGADHVRSIPNLRFLELVAFGKAVRSDRPTLVKRDFREDVLAASQHLT